MHRIGFIFLIFLSFPIFAKQNVTVYFDSGYKPFSYLDKSGKPKGTYVDIFKVIFSRLQNYHVKIELVPWERGKSFLKSGEGFALIPPYFHGHDWPYMYPYSIPFHTEKVVAICNKALTGKQKLKQWPNDFIGLTVGNVRGYDGWGGEDFHTLVKKGKIKYHAVDSASQLIRMTATGRSDCMMMNQDAYQHSIIKMVEDNEIAPEEQVNTFIAAVIGKDHVYVGYTNKQPEKYPYAADFRRALDIEIYKAIKSGELEMVLSNKAN